MMKKFSQISAVPFISRRRHRHGSHFERYIRDESCCMIWLHFDKWMKFHYEFNLKTIFLWLKIKSLSFLLPLVAWMHSNICRYLVNLFLLLLLFFFSSVQNLFLLFYCNLMSMHERLSLFFVHTRDFVLQMTKINYLWKIKSFFVLKREMCAWMCYSHKFRIVLET